MQTDLQVFTHCELSAPSLKRPLRLSLFLLRPLRVTEEESTATTMEALKARIRELERQILRGDRYKCLICMVSTPPPALVTRGRRRAKDERESYLVLLAACQHRCSGRFPLQFAIEGGGASRLDCSDSLCDEEKMWIVLASAHLHHMLELPLHLHPRPL